MLLSEFGHPLGGQAGVGEHANLASDMAPVVLAAELLEVALKEGVHLDVAAGNGRVRLERADEDLI